MAKGLFKKTKYITVSVTRLNTSEEVKVSPTENKVKEEAESGKPSIPNGMWYKCDRCGEIIYKKDIENNQMVCTKCKAHLRIGAYDRINMLADEESFQEFDKELKSVNPLHFPGYEDKLKDAMQTSGLSEAVVTGKLSIKSHQAIVAVMDSHFMMASMGSVVGEKLTRAVEKATELSLPVIIFTASGGARMQEGMYSLMQMAKVSAALSRHSEAGLLYITVLTDPTTGGVTASFAMLGDIIISEPGAVIGFAGRRVIEQTIKQKLPEEFQKAEFLLKHGFVDKIVDRRDMKDTLGQLLAIHEEAM